jgi:hypothetical protein
LPTTSTSNAALGIGVEILFVPKAQKDWNEKPVPHRWVTPKLFAFLFSVNGKLHFAAYTTLATNLKLQYEEILVGIFIFYWLL